MSKKKKFFIERVRSNIKENEVITLPIYVLEQYENGAHRYNIVIGVYDDGIAVFNLNRTRTIHFNGIENNGEISFSMPIEDADCYEEFS